MNIITKLRDEGLTAASSPEEIEEAVASLDGKILLRLAVWSVKYQLAKTERSEVRSIERAVQSPPAKKAEAKADRDEWMFKDPEYEMTKSQQDEFWSLPDTHPARRSWRARQESWERERKRGEEFQAIMEDSFNRLKQAWHLEWTTELLEQRITMPDGTSTTWGDATIEQHRERLEMFKGNALANLEGAARHQQAIDDLSASGANCLGELQQTAA